MNRDRRNNEMPQKETSSGAFSSGRRHVLAKRFALWLTANVLLWFAPNLWDWGRNAVSDWRLRYEASFYETRVSRDHDIGNLQLPYLFFRPDLNAEQKAPLVVVLHGSGERGKDGRSQLKAVGTFLVRPSFQSIHPCFVVAPQCPKDLNWHSRGSADVPGAVLGIIDDLIANETVDPSRVYLCGYSMGAFGCWHYLGAMPGRFAGCLAIAGGGNPEDADAIAHTPVWAIHGEDDPVIDVQQSRQMVDAVNSAGGNAKLTILKQCGHHSFQVVKQRPKAYLNWLFDQGLGKQKTGKRSE